MYLCHRSAITHIPKTCISWSERTTLHHTLYNCSQISPRMLDIRHNATCETFERIASLSVKPACPWRLFDWRYTKVPVLTIYDNMLNTHTFHVWRNFHLISVGRVTGRTPHTRMEPVKETKNMPTSGAGLLCPGIPFPSSTVNVQ